MTVDEGTAMTLEDYLSVPYVAVFWSSEGPDGEWIRNAEYPELPGVRGSGDSAIDALDELEDARVRFIFEAYRTGTEIPVPRPPLQSRVSGLTSDSVAETVAGLGAD